jgi:hypothetical protein
MMSNRGRLRADPGPGRFVSRHECRFVARLPAGILRSHENKTTAEVHDYLDERTGVLAAMLAKRAPGYTGLGFPDPRRIAFTPSASADGQPASEAAISC